MYVKDMLETGGSCHAEFSALVYLVCRLLAVGAHGAVSLSHRLAAAVAIPDYGDGGRRCA